MQIATENNEGEKIAGNKVFVIGLDGATFDLIKPWVAEGKLPNISKLMNSGSYGELHSTIPPLSPVAWTSFMTGKNPGKHGIFDFIQPILNSYQMRAVNATTRRSKAIWTILGDAGKKVGIINVPITYPPDEVNGFMISGLGTPGNNSDFTYPLSLYDEIANNIGDYYLGLDNVNVYLGADKQGTPADTLQRLKTRIENRTSVAAYLMEHYPWDYFVIVFTDTDIAQHEFWKFTDMEHPDYNRDMAEKYGDAIYQVYEKIDEKIGDLIEKISDDTVVVIMSDHGAGPVHKTITLQKWLEDKGFLKRLGAVEKPESIFSPRFLRMKSIKMMGAVVFQLKRLLPVQIRTWLKRRLPDVKGRFVSLQLLSDVDWEQTKAFSEGTAGNIYINLKGREPMGIVQSGEEYENLRDEIVGELMELKDPETGEGVVERVYKKEEIYSGEQLAIAPDLIIIWKVKYHNVSKFLRLRFGSKFDKNELFGVHRWSGCHKLNGIVILNGNPIKAEQEICGANIIDIAPTMLYLMGLPIPSDMDGDVLRAAIKEEYLQAHPPHRCGPSEPTGLQEEKLYSEEEARKVEDRLRKLGYLE